MAGRPPKTTADYFPHDANAGNGVTLKILTHLYGNNGYAAWFRLLELLTRTPGHYFDCRNIAKWQFLQAEMQLSEAEMALILNEMAKLEAIDPDLWLTNRVIWCQNLVNRLSKLYDSRKNLPPSKPIIDNINSISTPINAISANINSISSIENTQTKLKYTKLKYTKEEPPYPPPPARVAAAASFEDLSNRNGLFTELTTKFPSLDIKDELHKCSLWWSSSKRKVKSPELAFRNWLQKAVQIRSNGEKKENPAQRAAREYIETNQI